MAKKKFTLEETWRYHDYMWKWIDGQVAALEAADEPVDVFSLKEEWLEKHFPGVKIEADCFFCEYAGIGEGGVILCENCPGVFIDPDFDCEDADYNYRLCPRKFYQKTKDLYEIFLKNKAL